MTAARTNRFLLPVVSGWCDVCRYFALRVVDAGDGTDVCEACRPDLLQTLAEEDAGEQV